MTAWLTTLYSWGSRGSLTGIVVQSLQNKRKRKKGLYHRGSCWTEEILCSICGNALISRSYKASSLPSFKIWLTKKCFNINDPEAWARYCAHFCTEAIEVPLSLLLHVFCMLEATGQCLVDQRANAVGTWGPRAGLTHRWDPGFAAGRAGGEPAVWMYCSGCETWQVGLY